MKLHMVTRNQGKFREASLELSKFGIELLQIPDDKVELQSDDVSEIALFAARQAYARHRVPLVVDDTGLYIESLNGFPGPYSSYVLRKIGLQGVLRLLDGVTNRRACFRTAVAYVDGTEESLFTGETCGFIVEAPRGSLGFGYDPIFVPEGSNRTFAEMSVEEKNALSHRGRALRALGSWLASRSQSNR